VERKGGETLRREYNAAASSSPDAIGLISWNEFSENSYIEPSQRYGARYLQVLADIRGTKAPKISDFDSSNEPASSAKSYGPVVIGALLALIVGALFIALRRRVEHRPPREPRDTTHLPEH
jgi:hypothetical protein